MMMASLAAAPAQLRKPASSVGRRCPLTIRCQARPVPVPKATAAAAPAPVKANKTLYEKLGGAPAVEAAVAHFYKKVMADPLLVPFFEGVDMKKQAKKQTMFLTYVFGGLPNYNGLTLAASHAHLMRDKGLNLTHFDAVAGHLVATLKEMGVAQELIDEAVPTLMATRHIFDPRNLQKTSASSAQAPHHQDQ